MNLYVYEGHSLEAGEKVVFCRGFIYETRFAKGSDKSDLYNIAKAKLKI